LTAGLAVAGLEAEPRQIRTYSNNINSLANY